MARISGVNNVNFLKRKAPRNPTRTPTATDPNKVEKNAPIALKTLAEVKVLESSTSKRNIVRYRTIAIASFRMDSPKTRTRRDGLTPSRLKTAITVTGSVAEIRAPKTKHSVPEAEKTLGLLVAANIIAPTKSAENIVAKTANEKINPKFAKKSCLGILYPESKIIGGNKSRKNTFTSNSVRTSTAERMATWSLLLMSPPISTPNNKSKPASGTLFWFIIRDA
mmetsp:Transcript_13926/g.25784  ORF Transcript_13926/g.25784 Transcript_13926/m.25784 type:complete len:223 (-) Transcript_13926:297-965(-)